MCSRIRPPTPPGTPLLRRIAILPIRFYQLTLSWALGNQCRYTPTCSQYGVEAILVHGVFKGWALALWRIWRCQPFYSGGHDPVPPKSEK